MVAIFRHPIRRAQTVALAFITLCGAIAAFTSVALSGTKTGAALGLGLTFGPALLYAAIVAPLVFPFGLYAIVTPFDSILDTPAFGTITKIVGIAAAVALVFYMLRTKRFVDPPRSAIFWFLLLLWMTASMFWAIDVQEAQKLLPSSLELFLLYLVAAMMPMTMQRLRVASVATTIGGVIAALYGLYLYRSGVAEVKDRLWIKTDTASWNPDHFAESLILPITLCLITVIWARSTVLRLAAGVSAFVMLLAMVYTGARGPALGIVALVIYLLIRDRHRVQIGIVGAVLGAIALFAEGPKYIARWQEAQTNGGAGRIDIWRVGLHAFQQNWLLGAGYGNFPLAYDRAFIGVFQGFYVHWDRASHNILLGHAVELGAIGLVLLLLGWWAQFRMLKDIRETDERWPMRLALEGAMIGLFVAAFFSDIMIRKFVWLAFMLVAFTYNAVPQPVAEQNSIAQRKVYINA